MLTFITGPVRSGKSTLAERLARAAGFSVTYCATAARDDGDAEWVLRLDRHRAQRPPEWQVIETSGPHGTDLVALLREASGDRCFLVESLGTWIGDAIGRGAETLGTDSAALSREVESEAERLVDAIVRCAADIVVVSEEVGWGVVPPFPSGRIFRDVVGRANQRLAAAAARAYLVVSGVAIDLKSMPRIDSL
jgi:adenosylcobinamide kinase / adenosylcobinamide-phosphate guanylyltransferase